MSRLTEFIYVQLGLLSLVKDNQSYECNV